jgi:hypothetical protein
VRLDPANSAEVSWCGYGSTNITWPQWRFQISLRLGFSIAAPSSYACFLPLSLVAYASPLRFLMLLPKCTSPFRFPCLLAWRRPPNCTCQFSFPLTSVGVGVDAAIEYTDTCMWLCIYSYMHVVAHLAIWMWKRQIPVRPSSFLMVDCRAKSPNLRRMVTCLVPSTNTWGTKLGVEGFS